MKPVLPLKLISVVIYLTCLVQTALSHAPHDVIADVQYIKLDSGYEIITIVRGDLFMSLNGNTFTRIVHGLDNTEILKHLAYNSLRPGNIYMSTGGNGIYFSNDFGHFWQKCNNGLKDLNINLVEISSYNPEFIIATGNDSNLYISKNSGEYWQSVYTENRRIVSIAFTNNQVIAINDTGCIYSFSETLGTLKPIYKLPAEYGKVLRIAISPEFDNTGDIFVGTEKGLAYVSLANNKTISNFRGLPNKRITGIAYSKNYIQDNTIYALFGYQGFYMSNDKGVNWKKMSKGLTADPQAYEYDVPEFTDLRTYSYGKDELMYICGFDGLFYKNSFSNEWSELNTLNENLIVGIAISGNFKNDQSVAYITYLNGPVLSTNRGNTWESLFKNGIILDNLLSKGVGRMHDCVFYGKESEYLNIITTQNIYKYDRKMMKWTKNYLAGNKSKLIEKTIPDLFSQNKNHISEPTYIIDKINNSDDFIVATRHSLLYNFNSNTKQIEYITGLNNMLVSMSISSDYIIDSTLLVGTYTNGLSMICGKTIKSLGFNNDYHILAALSPGFHKDSIIFAGTYSGLYKSYDRGLSWSKMEVDSTHKNAPISSLALSPNFICDGTLLVTLKGYGLFKSTNGGISFSEIGNELIETNNLFSPVEYFPANSGTIKFSPSYRTDSTLFAFSDINVFKSVDGGVNWIRLEMPVFEIKKNKMMIIKGALYELRYDLVFITITAIILFLIVLKIRKLI